MTAENIKAGFKRTGIWPPDSDALPDYLFAVNKQSESSGLVLELKELVQLYFRVQLFTVGPVNNFYRFTLHRHAIIIARFIRAIACVGSGDPVRVLCLYTTNTLDEV